MKKETIGNRLRRLREEAGLSQRELSSPGVSYAYISRIEAGARQPSVKAIRLLAHKLKTTPLYLEHGNPAPPICPHCLNPLPTVSESSDTLTAS